jgi:heme-degrading monooxygenase HmoA
MTQSVLFDVLPKPGHVDQYFSMAAHLKPIVEKNPGFLSVERFANLQKPNWYLSFSCWKNEESLAQWRCQPDHNGAQVCGRNQVFDDYRLRVSAKKQIQELVESRSRELILLLIGQLDAVQEVASSSTLSQHQSKAYQGVLNPKRGLSIYEFAPNASIDDDLFCMKDSESIEIHWFSVVRDYGMFNRAEAPTQFA